MTSFIIALALLVGGYFIYGKYVASVFGVHSANQTPVQRHKDGVDYVPLPTWKIFLIQFLNIAGLGPIFGAIMGIAFGPAAFLWIVFGTVFGGAVHDFLGAMMSMRSNGASLPETVGEQLGSKVKVAMRVFAMILMVLVGAVFVYNPADLLAMLTPGWMDRMVWILIILAYYVAAALLPVDKVIGKVYPLFGFALLFMALGVLGGVIWHADSLPEMWEGMYNHKANPDSTPIFPMMFVSIACGAISGFHATQSPMMVRCLSNEGHARAVFYGAMVAEGIVALIWAAAAIAFTGGYEALQANLSSSSPAVLVNSISTAWLGTFGGLLAVLGVIAAPITSGDTALRSARLIAADFMGLEQKSIRRRLYICVPVFMLCVVVMMLPYEVLWRYFAWFNQMLSVFTLWAITVWLARHDRNYYITLIPALFMTCVCTTYILYAPEGVNAVLGNVLHSPMPYGAAVGCGIAAALGLLLLFGKWRRAAAHSAIGLNE